MGTTGLDSGRGDQVDTIDLEELSANYQRALIGVGSNDTDSTLDEAFRLQYHQQRFVRVAGVIPEAPFRCCLEALSRILPFVATPVVMRHAVMDDGRLGDGHRFSRVDVDSIRDPESKRRLQRLFDGIGLDAFGEALARRLVPRLARIVGPVRYERVFVSVYEEADYISVHDDRHMGDRIDAHFSASFNTPGALRVLGPDGLLHTYLDEIGAMNVLGPRVWHDVPPIMRCDATRAPLRLTLTLRLAATDGNATS